MKDYLYGKLNKEVEQVLYKGSDTDTAKVNIDNTNYTISVDVHKYSSPVANMVVGYSNSGTLRSNDPVNEIDVTNKRFVENSINEISVDVQEQIDTLTDDLQTTKIEFNDALSGKLDKKNGPDPDLEYAYTVADGHYQELKVIGYGPGYIAQYDENNQLRVPVTPTWITHATSKKYVDDSVGNVRESLEGILSRLSAIESALTMKSDSSLVNTGANTDPGYGEIIEGERQG